MTDFAEGGGYAILWHLISTVGSAGVGFSFFRTQKLPVRNRPKGIMKKTAIAFKYGNRNARFNSPAGNARLFIEAIIALHAVLTTTMAREASSHASPPNKRMSHMAGLGVPSYKRATNEAPIIPAP